MLTRPKYHPKKNDRFQKFNFSKEKLHTITYNIKVFTSYTTFEKGYPIDFNINWHSEY